ncbi:DNA replication licensing factor MCM5 [Dissostichus eleginoides]|uniref:DNA replication licensing factor MCM5 n=1 Tax=Dissostichus eleginoides TaxID=100907 RepID=A0AAD9BB83_DISEL|nr:DNA replication licensing factor MCM5 [Dissostichus eleginoides]
MYLHAASLPACIKVSEAGLPSPSPSLCDSSQWECLGSEWYNCPEKSQRKSSITDLLLTVTGFHLSAPRAIRSWQGNDSNTEAVNQSCREAKPKGGGSHVACNFLEAIKSTLFNSLSNTPAILAAKWSFSAKLSIQRRECESTLQNKAQHIG